MKATIKKKKILLKSKNKMSKIQNQTHLAFGPTCGRVSKAADDIVLNMYVCEN